MKLSISSNFDDVLRDLDRLQKDVQEQATARAINRTLEQARTSMSREIRAEFNMPAAKVNQALRITRASFKRGVLEIEGVLESPTKRGRSLNLINFAARRTAKGVTVKVKREGARKLIPGAFIANEGRTVFIREGKKRLPIKALQTIDIAQMFNTKRINRRVLQFINQKFPEVFAHEAKYYTDRFNARGART
jgi:hypothetical protein